jgi:uncharacterized SAM-binding protein YcdF (DUF218 family)
VKRIMRRGAAIALVALLVLIAVVWLAPQWVLPPLAAFLDISEPPTRTDYVLVLNGDPETRPFAAAALVRAGLADEILLPRQDITLESASVQDGAIPSEIEITQRILRVRGVADEKVHVLPGKIGNTWGEAQVLADFLDEHPGASVTVVTNGFHTRRARGIFRRVLGDRAGDLHFLGVPRDGVDAETWWRTRRGCVVYGSEYAKLLYYQVR